MNNKRIATAKPGVFYRELEGDKPSKPFGCTISAIGAVAEPEA